MNKKEKQVGKISPHDHPFKPDPKDGACKVCGCLEGTHGKQVSLGFREKLKELVKRDEDWDEKPTYSEDQLVAAILKLIREEVVPDEKAEWRDDFNLPVKEFVLGKYYRKDEDAKIWNSCRSAMLRKLGGDQ